MGCPGNSDRLSCDFAGQLERLGLWEWAVFVLLNVNNEELRKRSVCTVLERNVSLEEEVGNPDESFCFVYLGGKKIQEILFFLRRIFFCN